MADIQAFRAFRYDLGRVGALERRGRPALRRHRPALCSRRSTTAAPTTSSA